ncbi:hypothetical protein R3P38DRAFT_3318934 [Favolaschia claudopus]|uniref:Integrase core domain-containing protein n=1 Tax=Favolaschia claudopus TaxID=2862362 RepID=A0AAW0B288_9AGAR
MTRKEERNILEFTVDVQVEMLDAKLTSILEVFPDFGRRMLIGRLKGHHVPRSRIAESYLRVHGAPGRFGLVRFKIVIHCFINGNTRLVTGIPSNNNLAQMVLDLFLKAVEEYGLPSQARRDHGTENVLVAAYMKDVCGAGRGSYIWGRSVHKTRDERLWYNVIHGFVHHGLNLQIPAHIWLLHHLFLNSINANAQDMYQDSPRGLKYRRELDDEPLNDPSLYGIDWDVADDPALMHHLLTENPQDWAERNPFAPDCPFPPDAVRELDRRLAAAVDLSSRNLHMGVLIATETKNEFTYSQRVTFQPLQTKVKPNPKET